MHCSPHPMLHEQIWKLNQNKYIMCMVLVIQLQNDNCLVKNITTSYILRFLKKNSKKFTIPQIGKYL